MLARRPSRLVPAPLVKPGRPKPDHSLFSPLERNPLSPKGWKKREADGVGLGFVASLDRARQTAVCRPADLGDFPVADFLSCCNLCKKRLHGKDIYMYRGETAFCSKECREQQILSDERTEKCSSRAAMMPPEISASPCSGGARKLFFAGITAA